MIELFGCQHFKIRLKSFDFTYDSLLIDYFIENKKVINDYFETVLSNFNNMKQSIVTIAFCLFIVSYFCLAQSRSIGSNSKSAPLPKASINTIDYSSVAVFKTASRKKEYRIGDLISIDVGIFNKAEEPIYFLDLHKFATISVQDMKGNTIRAGYYGYPLYAPDFSLVNKGSYEVSHFLFLLTCEDIRKDDSYNADNNFSVSMEKRFNDDGFVNLGRGCIDIRKSGKYLITMSISNSYPQADKTKKTAIGEMVSSPLEITIIE